jgi:hypothetical protein
MAMITDYDSWKIEEEPVSAEIVLSHLLANAETARESSQTSSREFPMSRTGRNIPRWTLP